jgi:hypothetical protein
MSARSCRRSLLRVCSVALLVSGTPAFAQGFFLPASDAQVRSDVTLLADEGVLRLLTNAWPIPAADVREQVRRIDVDSIHALALQLALERLRVRLIPQDEHESQEWRIREMRVTAGRPGLLRDYGTPGRETLELQSVGGASTDRWSVTLAATGAAAPDDDHSLRLDGSELSVRLGNWLFSANQLERWWGPGWDGSLILSTNARPMPGISFDRQDSSPFDIPILRWIGPWRFTGFLAGMEENRADVQQPLFMGMRASFKPLQILELGLSRTAQFCGRGRPCNARTFWNVLAGNDNAGLRVSPEDEPGNQMAGLDLRLTSPFRSLPVALSGQFIGEDNSSSGIPERYLGLLAIDTWQMFDSGALLRARVEYANTNCKFASPTSDFPSFQNCAYRQGVFTAGYRHYSRNVGHTTDADAESLAVRATLQLPSGQTWGAAVRRALLDRYGGVDPDNPLTRGPGEYQSVELSWRGQVFGQDLALQVGVERHEPGGMERRTRGIGLLTWRKAL